MIYSRILWRYLSNSKFYIQTSTTRCFETITVYAKYLGDWEGLYIVGDFVEEYLENIFKRGYEPVKIPLDR